jgi:potassium efflux system protein
MRRNAAGSTRYFVLVIAASLIPNLTYGQDAESRAEPVSSRHASSTTSASAHLMDFPAETGIANARAETIERLKLFEPATTTDGNAATRSVKPELASTPVSKSVSSPSSTAPGSAAPSSASIGHAAPDPLAALLQDRLRWLSEYEEITRALQKATYPQPSPEQQAAESKTDLQRLQDNLSQAAQNPEMLLPTLFRGSSATVTNAVRTEMKDAIEATGNELKELKTKLETATGEITKWDGHQNARHTERDRLFQQVTTSAAKSREHEAAVTDAQTTAARRLAHERLINFQWEARVQALRLKVVEAQIILEAKLADVRDLNVKVCRTHVRITEKTLERMQARYRVVSEAEQRDLTQSAADLESKARLSDDPLERFRARRTAELLVLEAQVIKSEQAVAISPAPSYEEQKTLADRAEVDFARVKELLDDGDVSRLDAIRLNNEFRRIGPERDRLVKNEMAAVESQLQFCENLLTSVELDLLQGSLLHDRFERDLLRERLPSSRWAEGEAVAVELERKHRVLLVRRRVALEKLSIRASHTLHQVMRRLGILDQEYGFIRTNIFWVRDQDPIGLLTLSQGAQEFNHLVRGLLRLGQETLKPNLWGQPSAEFMVTALSLLALPFGLMWLRILLGARIRRDVPVPRT